MNCRDIESLILTERDGVLTTSQHAELDRHAAECPACRQLRARLAEAMEHLKSDAATVAVPDVDKEWRTLRAQLHSDSTSPAKKRPFAPVIWFGTALAAAVALVFLSKDPAPPPAAVIQVAEAARADYVEAGDANASTMVYVDKDSGWLVVWATDADTKSSG